MAQMHTLHHSFTQDVCTLKAFHLKYEIDLPRVRFIPTFDVDLYEFTLR